MRAIRQVKMVYRVVLLFTLAGFGLMPAKLSAGNPGCDATCRQSTYPGIGYCCGDCTPDCSMGVCFGSCSACCS